MAIMVYDTVNLLASCSISYSKNPTPTHAISVSVTAMKQGTPISLQDVTDSLRHILRGAWRAVIHEKK
eukprot:1149973-Pelagomonas_calceolata.AAC.1